MTSSTVAAAFYEQRNEFIQQKSWYSSVDPPCGWKTIRFGLVTNTRIIIHSFRWLQQQLGHSTKISPCYKITTWLLVNINTCVRSSPRFRDTGRGIGRGIGSAWKAPKRLPSHIYESNEVIVICFMSCHALCRGWWRSFQSSSFRNVLVLNCVPHVIACEIDQASQVPMLALFT